MNPKVVKLREEREKNVANFTLHLRQHFVSVNFWD